MTKATLLFSFFFCFVTGKTIFCQDKGKDVATDTIDVRAEYFKKVETSNTSFTHASYEDLRKTPGAGEDIVKYFQSSPGVAVSRDDYNDLIVRGGSPIENLVTVDGMEIRNPNHYGPPGSSSGALCYINLNLVKEADFYNGGFPALYGDRISSVLDIKFKEGSLVKHRQEINLSMLGIGAFVEGPLSKKSSYMVSVRRSYFELLKSQLNFSLLPDYWDLNMKLNFNISRNEQISFLALGAIDNAKPYDSPFSYAGDTVNLGILTMGINYKISKTSYDASVIASSNLSFYRVDYLPEYTLTILDNSSNFTFNIKYKLFSGRVLIENTGGVKYLASIYNVQSNDYITPAGFYIPDKKFDLSVRSVKLFETLNITTKILGEKIVLNSGLRFDYFSYMSDNYTVSPRGGFSIRLGKNTSINANAGIYFQTPEFLWLLSDPNNINLSSIRANQYVLGVEHFLSNDIKFTLEGYLKRYTSYPVSVYNPEFVFISSGINTEPSFIDRAVSVGRGYFQGIDLFLQKKNSGKGVFASLSVSLTKSSFIALAGPEHAIDFDYGKQLIVISGYKFSDDFSIGARFKYAGGRPYTPFNYEMSKLIGYGRYEDFMYNRARMPEYVRLDARVDKSFSIGNATIAAYIEVFNILNRTNISDYYWSHTINDVKANLQFSILPVLGLAVKFD